VEEGGFQVERSIAALEEPFKEVINRTGGE